MKLARTTFDRRSNNGIDDIEQFYYNKLMRELSQLFKWENLPPEIPYDYMEKALIHTGRVMYFYDNDMGYMTLACHADGINVYGKPIRATAIRIGTNEGMMNYKRKIIHRYDENIEKDKACVVIENMYDGDSMAVIVSFYAKRLANLQRAFDTNSLWQNLPPIFTALNDDMKLSINKLFTQILSGKPWTIVDKEMLMGGKGVPVQYIDIKSKLAELYDAMNEVYNSFKETVGIDSPGADKKERLITDEVNSNKQSIQTCLQIMLTTRQVACEEINDVFDANISVDVRRPDSDHNEEVEDNGLFNDRVEEPITD